MSLSTASLSLSDCTSDDAFWPPINLTSLRKALSLSSSISEGRLRTAAHGATATVNKALTVWQQHIQQQGYGYLEEVPAPTINNCSVLVAHYLSAVEATAAIELYQHFKIEKCGRRCSMNEPPAAHLFTHEYRHHDE